MREQFIRLLGGVKPYRDFTFERFRITSGNRTAVQLARHFDATKENIYLWGPHRVGKTHLAIAILRQWFARCTSIELVTPFQLIRKLRMKPPDEEQHAIDTFIRVPILVIDDLGTGSDTPYARQVLQEILDGRDFSDRRGLVVTSQFPLNVLSRRLNDHAIASRLSSMCRVAEIRPTFPTASDDEVGRTKDCA